MAVAKGKSITGEKSDIKYKWVGLLGIKDPVRDGVRDSLAVCKTAGIKVMMITGDYQQPR